MPQMSMSPNVNSYGEPPAAEQAAQLFKERFSDTAFAILRSKFPDLAPSVVTFKILETDADTGRAVGAFVLLHENRPIYIPLIMTDSQPKPLDMFYYKELNIFLPLSKEWLEEVTKMSLDEMGQGEDVPNSVATDVNLRNIVMPPETQSGRVGLASDLSLGANQMFKAAQDQEVDIPPQFLNVIRQSPKVALDGIKVAFQKHPALLQKLASVYGHQNLVGAFNDGYARHKRDSQLQEKVASSQKGALHVFTKTAAPNELKSVFGVEAGAAFMGIVHEGYAVKDTRHVKHAAVSVKQETEIALQSPGPSPGWFKLFFMDGPAGNFLVIPNPIDSNSGEFDGEIGDYYYTGTDYRSTSGHRKKRYLVVDVTGKEAWTAHGVMGFPVLQEKDVNKSKLWKLLNRKGTGDTPRPNAYGFFIHTGPHGLQATEPFSVDQIVDTGDGRTRVEARYGAKYIRDTDPTRQKINVSLKGQFVLLPKNTKWIEIGLVEVKDSDSPYERSRAIDKVRMRSRRESLINDPKLMYRWMNNILQTSGARKARVKRAGHELWWVENSNRPHVFGEALHKVAEEYDISVDGALDVLKEAQKIERNPVYILDAGVTRQLKVALDKTAQPPGQVGQEIPMAPGPQGGMPMGPPPGGMPMEQPMGPPASPMSGTDLAIAEAVNTLREQANMQMQQSQDQMMMQQQQIEQQSQSSQQLIGILEGIQQRAQQINSATGGAIPMGAEQSPATAAQMIAPMPEEEPPPPPQPVMDEEVSNLTPETIGQQINPEMLDQAQELDDGGVFDTAAIAMLSAAPVLQDIVAAYIPNLEKCLDNIGRILLTLWMREDETKTAVGDEAFILLEDKLRTVFKNLGDAILEINRNAVSTEESLQEIQQMSSDQQ
ncbi:MAG: hypothetical protein DRJ03_07620 [Chloroflexi bacterium]|nr:MAG: hypothetical protein DRJ03_07620 [Chloroflexota bacterium]